MDELPAEADPAARGWWFYENSRYELALAEVPLILALDPNGQRAHTLAALALSALGRSTEALVSAREAIRVSPDEGYTHYVLAFVLHFQGQLAAAREALRISLSLDPSAVYAHRLGSLVALGQGDWKRSLASAESGLALDPTDAGCLTFSAAALRRLGRLDEANARAQLGLASSPESAVAHDTRGWVLLQQGRATEARLHFEESLRLDPNFEHAREGLLSSLRGRYGFYRAFLRARLWVSYLPSHYRFSAFVALFLTVVLVAKYAPKEPGDIILTVLIFGGLAFEAFVKLADPLMNVLVRCLPRGRWLLRPHQLVGANLLIALAVAALGLLPVILFVPHERDSAPYTLACYLCAWCVATIFPVAITFDRSEAKERRRLAIALGLLAVMGLVPMVWSFYDLVMGLTIGMMFFLACFVFTLLGGQDRGHAAGA